MKVKELIDNLLAVAEPDTEIEWRVVGSVQEEVEISSAGFHRGAITTQVDIDAVGELNDIYMKNGKAMVEVWL